MEKYRNQIKNWLERKDRRQSFLADKAGITRACLSQFLSGKRKGISLQTWDKLRQAMGYK